MPELLHVSFSNATYKNLRITFDISYVMARTFYGTLRAFMREKVICRWVYWYVQKNP